MPIKINSKPEQDFWVRMKLKCEAKAKGMAKMEFSVWDSNHEDQLKKHFGYNDKRLLERKEELARIAL
jgi:hypothetical protein